ncbi:MAG: DNA gyrase subunit A [Porphyromonas sp.]|nr:DNA gyrase subunit A [Porphyromonas sp.]
MEHIDKIIKVNVEEQMKSAYIDYAMSVIVSRALPDVRDGFKPVHRRILYGMNELGNTPDKPYKKCARIVGDVMGKYHPHGDSSIYMALVRLAQDFSVRYQLVDPHGNFGSVDGDSPAAMRYTEARLHSLAMQMLADINKDTVDFQNNYDDSSKEPTVLPTRFPNLLVNGGQGIAVGMATNMAPHNLTESINGALAYIEKRGDITVKELMEHIKAPDFPTGGVIYGYDGVVEAYETGRGKIVIRGKAEIETESQHEQIVINELPYLVNKAELVRHISELAAQKKIDGISDIADETSNKNGTRIVIAVKRDANANVILNQLYKYTPLQSSFSINSIALVNGRPKLLTLKDIIGEFVKHRHEVVIRRTRFDLKRAEDRLHILEGRIIATDNIDEVVAIIKASSRQTEAMERLMARFGLSQIQARNIVEMRLGQLTGMELEKLHEEYEDIKKQIEWFNKILTDDDTCYGVISDELVEVREKFGDERRSIIDYSSGTNFNPEDFYADDEMVITLSHLGYIKRTPLAAFRQQGRGGIGAKGSETRDEDFVEYIYSASMHATMLFFTEKGKCFWLPVYEIPEGSRQAKGRAVQNLLNIDPDDKISACIRVKRLTTDIDFVRSHYITFVTQNGTVRKTSLEAFSRPRANGIIAIKLVEDDKVVSVLLSNGDCQFLLASRNGKAVRFHEDHVRPSLGRNSIGVRGIRLDDDGEDHVVGAICVKHPERESILVVSENGFGKRSVIDDYRQTNRGTKGVLTLKVTSKTGKLVSMKNVTDDNDLMIINKSGIVIRISVNSISMLSRNTQGVKLINLQNNGDEIASVTVVEAEGEEEFEDVETDTQVETETEE